MKEDAVVDPQFSMGRFEHQEFESKIEIAFPRELQIVLYDNLRKRIKLDVFFIKFAFVDLSYNSLEVILAALGIEKTAAIYGLAGDAGYDFDY